MYFSPDRRVLERCGSSHEVSACWLSSSSLSPSIVASNLALLHMSIVKGVLSHCFQVVEYLSEAERMHVVVEPRMYDEAVAAGLCTDRLFTYTPQEATR